MDQQELRILLVTVASTAGATQTQAALRGVVVQAEQVNTNLRRTGDAARAASSGFDQSAKSILGLAGAMTGVGFGVGLFATAFQKTTDVLRDSITAQAENERITRATAAAYGLQAASFERFATGLSEQTGFTRQSILEAALSARTLSQNYQLTIDQTQKLISVSADLARVRGIGVAEAFERVQSAIRGEAEASEFLGLTLNATFLQQNAANGAYRQTFTTLTDAQRAQVVYNEVLRQTAAFQGLAAQSAAGLDGAMGRANVAGSNLSLTLGRLIEPQTITGLNAATATLNTLAAGLRALGDAQRNIPDIKPGGFLLTFLGALGPLGGTVPELRAILEIMDRISAAERKRAEEQQNNALILGQTRLTGVRVAERAALEERADLILPVPAVRTFGQAAERAQKSVSDLIGELRLLQNAASSLGTITAALGRGDVGNRALTAAAAAVNAIDQARTAQAALLAEQRDLQNQAKITDPRDVAGANAVRERLRLVEQLVPLESALLQTQETQRQLADATAQSMAEQARIELSMLPARQEMARLDREANSAQAELARLMRERQVLLAQQAAAPAINALEDTQNRLERDRLVLANRRGTTIEERQAARRDARDIERNILPAQRLTAFDAQTQLDTIRRTAGAADLTEQLRRNAIAQRGAEIRQMIEPVEAQKALVEAQTTQLQLLAQIVQGKEVVIRHQIEVKIDGAVSGTVSGDVAADVAGVVGDRVYRELTEANGQAGLPPTIPVSAVRRG